MPYTFPYENEFIAGIGLLIVGLLVMRWLLVRKGRSSKDGVHSENL